MIVKKEIKATVEELEHRILTETVAGVKAGEKLTKETAKKVADAKKGEMVAVRPFVTLEIEYLNAIVEDRKIIAHAGVELDENRNFAEALVEARVKGHPETTEIERIDFMMTEKHVL